MFRSLSSTNIFYIQLLYELLSRTNSCRFYDTVLSSILLLYDIRYHWPLQARALSTISSLIFSSAVLVFSFFIFLFVVFLFFFTSMYIFSSSFLSVRLFCLFLYLFLPLCIYLFNLFLSYLASMSNHSCSNCSAGD